jgi:uncharacterized protein YbcV (DUF1398 family)
MNAQQKTLARKCLDAAEGNTMTFPQIIVALMEGGFEGYTVDLRRSVAIYYLPTGSSVELPLHKADGEVRDTFDAVALQSAIREAQQLVAGYTYKGFCIKAKAAGCAGYMVSFSGRRAVYFGRTAETHLEVFPSGS